MRYGNWKRIEGTLSIEYISISIKVQYILPLGSNIYSHRGSKSFIYIPRPSNKPSDHSRSCCLWYSYSYLRYSNFNRSYPPPYGVYLIKNSFYLMYIIFLSLKKLDYIHSIYIGYFVMSIIPKTYITFIIYLISSPQASSMGKRRLRRLLRGRAGRAWSQTTGGRKKALTGLD